MIPVTKPFLPPIDDYNLILEQVWKRQYLTNRGPVNLELENKLKKHLNVNNLLFVTNGTIALQLAIKALDLHGEIITTSFTYVATTSSIVWEGCTPVYVDIDKNSLNIDSTKIEAAITKNTVAIMATHVYGNPCNVLAIQQIADKYNLKVIYDAAHAFGVKVDGISIFNYGDISTCSTHATKLFHTVEGGFVVTKDLNLFKKVSYMSNFGHDGPENYQELGINGKNSEFHAAMGLVNLKFIDDIHDKRKKITEHYNLKLKYFKAIKPLWYKKSSNNYSYYPIVFESEALLLKSIELLSNSNIHARRYFYPSLASILPYTHSVLLEHTDSISKRVLCLPLFYNLSIDEVDLICKILFQAENILTK